ncbi:DUF1223 domain-containing protein [Maribacter ulvicola]|uniref:DUF1223 domain-containing protein n=1 Tax=Maribacter ulvicola TaxID=228959 RepID=A0A1N6VN61_9FLAO|nr:DUF1223 domain-containing protein [Maribacter ulvicola]SIQ79178.1 hypothetical protein SAMN05421797_103186 [Maribacter ulvicola]
MFNKKIAVFGILSAGLFLMSFMQFKPSKYSKVDDVITLKKVENVEKGMVVLELFTSQGCSSCPPADALLETVKNNFPEQVFALSYHVDYWNYIGWKDPFSNKDFTIKQRKYNNKFRYRSNYTPELIVNGKEHMVGSNKVEVARVIEKYAAKQSKDDIRLNQIHRGGDKINFNYNLLGDTATKNVRAVLLLKERTTEVKRGENRQRTLKNANIVIAEKYLKLKDVKGMGSIDIPASVKTNEDLILMLLVENNDADITGAVKVAI